MIGLWASFLRNGLTVRSLAAAFFHPDFLYAHQPECGLHRISCLTWNTARCFRPCSSRCGSDSHGFTSRAGRPYATFSSTPSSASSAATSSSAPSAYALLAVQPDRHRPPEPAQESELGAHPQREGGREEQRVERGNHWGGRVPH